MSLAPSLKFAFASKKAVPKLLKGGGISILFFTVYFAFVVMGYLMRVLCNALEGRVAALPEWDGTKRLFNEGVQPMLVMMVYYAPVILLLVIKQLLEFVMDGAVPFIYPAIGIAGICCSFFLPLALMHFAIKGQAAAAFDFGTFVRFVQNNFRKYTTTWLMSLVVAVTALVFGILLFGIGLFFTYFAAAIVNIGLFASLYRESEPFCDDAEGKQRASMIVPPPLSRT